MNGWPKACARCGHDVWPQKTCPPAARPHLARGLCRACWFAARKDGTLADFERTGRSRADVLEDWELLRSEGYTRRQAAERLGMTYAAFERARYRALADGDARAAP